MTHDKYFTWNRPHPQNMVHYKNRTPCEKIPKGYICQGLRWVIFRRKFLNFLNDSDSWSWDFKIAIFPFQNHILGTLLCLINVEVGPIIIRLLVVFQKTNNVVARCHLCWVPFLGGGNFDKRSPFLYHCIIGCHKC